MGRTDRVLIAIALILLLLTAASYFGIDGLFSDDHQVDVGDSIAEVVDGRGDIRVKFSNQFQWQKGRINQKLVYDDAVFSGESSTVDLRIGESKLKLDSNTLVVIRQEKRFKSLNLSRGMLSGFIAKNEPLQIETGSGEKIELNAEVASNISIERRGAKTSVRVVSGNARIVKDGKAQNLSTNDKIEFIDRRPRKNDPIQILTPERSHIYSRDARVGLDFQWRYSSGNTAAPNDEFVLEFAQDPTFSRIAMREIFAGQTRFSTSLTLPQSLYFRLKDNRGNFSVTKKLVLAQPAVPVILSPKAASEMHVHRGQSSSVLFKVDFAQPGGVARLQVARSRDFGVLVVDEVIPSRQRSWSLPVGEYFARARGEFEGDQLNGDWSEVVTFAVREKINPLDLKRANLPTHIIIPNLNYPSMLYGARGGEAKTYLSATTPFVEFFSDLTFTEHTLKAKRRDVDSESLSIAGAQFPDEWIEPGLTEIVYHVEDAAGARFPPKMHRTLIEMEAPNRLAAGAGVLSWSPILFARGFEVEVRPDKGEKESFTVDKTWFQPVLAADTKHKFRVRALGPRGPISAWSKPHHFKTRPAPPQVIQSENIKIPERPPERKPAAEQRPPSTVRVKPEKEDLSLWEKVGAWLWGGSGYNYVNVRQTIANTADVEYKNTKGPSAYLEAGWLGTAKFGGVVSYKRTPGDVRVDNYPINKRSFVWTTTSAEGLWLTPWHMKLWRMPVVWTVRAGVQNHYFPFLYVESGNQLVQATNNILSGSIGFIAETIKSKIRYYWSMRYQQPIQSSSEGGNTFTLTPILAFDGSVGASYNFTERWKLGAFWYGQLHSYKFNYSSALQSNAGVQNLFYSNMELRVGVDF